MKSFLHSSSFCQSWYPIFKWPSRSTIELLPALCDDVIALDRSVNPSTAVWSCRSNRVMASDTAKHFWSCDRCVSMSIHFLSRTRMETEVSVTVGFCSGLVLAMGFTEAISPSSLVSIDSVTYLSTPVTIVTQDAVLSWNKDCTRTSILYQSSW